VIVECILSYEADSYVSHHLISEKSTFRSGTKPETESIDFRLTGDVTCRHWLCE